ncbi:HET domain-containing protein [Fusarium keratoplasticum]|uniref:HET domain-containing protein n=1 Tax=Fusarium keratoplasticum TaxID=1328300 RepID=A0ACC0QQ13_9HYPO|nr:HET domain-containing protein [Fusarium keratoplasticum]KAI8660883.1 HET domain-containing protein [Fusarium keratoplasticum]
MDESNHICDACRAVDIAKYLSHNDPISTPMGYFQDILKNEDCTLCKLIVKALSVYARSYWLPGKYPVEMCYLGRLSGNSTPGRIEVWFHATSKTLPDGIWGHFTVLGRIKCLESVEPPVLERLNYSLIRSWMDDCTTRHGPKCNPPGLSRDCLPLILLDVKQMRLFKSDRHCRYLALSYVWGKAKQFTTVKSSFQELQQDGALLRVRDQLPQLINDAIAFVADLGETYLWVDALCIVQDDPEVKEFYVPCMDKIYGQALLTIVVLAGSDANCALPGIATGSRTPSQSPVQLGSLILAPELRSLAATVESSTWRSRGWTFQEGMLSRKRLYFSNSQVYWHCSVAHRSEDGEESPAGELSSWSMNPLERQVSHDPRQRFNIYESLVKQYTRRTLTYPSDSLNAFVGILSAIEDSFGWQFASALPENCFDLALLWSSMWQGRLRPREPLGSACKSPTWCWTAWEDDIYWDPWRLGSYAGKRVTLKSEVGDFIIMDKVGGRKIVREDHSLREALPNSLPALSEASELAALNGNSTNYALVFESLSLGADIYTISSPRPELSRTLSRPFSDSFTNTLRGQLWIYDAAGHHCGTLRGFNSWNPCPDSAYEFVLLSRSDQDKIIQADVDGYRDHLPLEYPSADEYYEEIFDTSIYQYKSWWALNILLVERKEDLSQRLAVGQLHADAWDAAKQKMKSFVLV